MLIQSNGFFAEVNLPEAPKGEGVHVLPPYNRQNMYVVDEYPACPTSWMHGSDKASSFFLPVKPGRHLWLDFNRNFYHTHQVAIVLSVQGINPVTGQKTDNLRLEQYREKCPVHDIKFEQDRFCNKCEYKWPAQNYITTVSTPTGLLWVDGWRAQEGEIRGFLITAETMRGVAAQIIGEDRVFAIGIAFYQSKLPKPVPIRQSVLRSANMFPSSCVPCSVEPPPSFKSNDEGTWIGLGDSGLTSSIECSTGKMFSKKSGGPGGSSVKMHAAAPASAEQWLAPAGERRLDEPKSIEVEKLEIGAGSRITQELSYFDSTDLSDYQSETSGMIYINYCSETDFNKIISAGKRDFTKGGEGYLAGLKTGN